MGIKGGIARKVMKLMIGVPLDAPHLKSEIGGDYDIDVLIMVDKASKEAISYARKAVTGMYIGGMILGPKDVEVLPILNQPSYI